MGGQDSFLDIISNIVGILIILVMIAGVRAQNAPVAISSVEENQEENEIEYADDTRLETLKNQYETSQEKINEALRLRDSIEATAEQMEELAQQTELRQFEQAKLFNAMVELRAELNIRAESKDQATRERLELQRQIQEIDAQLVEMERTRTWMASNRPKATVMENIPTPISKTVEDKEAHFRLLNGRIAYVPIRELMDKLNGEVALNQNKFLRQPTSSGIIGAIDNFNLEYLLVSHDALIRDAYGTGIGKRLEIDHVNFVPVRDTVGQAIDEALTSQDSDFMKRLRGYRQDIYTITFWVYPDSFEHFRTVKQFLYERGYQVAARPLEFGKPISGSPRGSKSASQ